MKKLLIVLGAVFLIVLVLVGGGVAYLAVNGSALDRESKAFADAVISSIIGGWDERELESRVSPEFRAATTSSDLDKLFAMFRRLGNLKSYNGSKGDANISVTTQSGKQITATYVGSADFENGPAQIAIRLIKHGDQWQILAFRVDSRSFLDQH